MNARLQSASQYATNACGQKLVGCGKVRSITGLGTSILKLVGCGRVRAAAQLRHPCMTIDHFGQPHAMNCSQKKGGGGEPSTTCPIQMLRLRDQGEPDTLARLPV